jgi:hypothetical protein
VLEDMKQNQIRNQLIVKIDWHGFFGFSIQILKVGSTLGPTINVEELLHNASIVAQILSLQLYEIVELGSVWKYVLFCHICVHDEMYH